MARITILEVTVNKDDTPGLFKARIDQPKTHQEHDIYSFTLSGWALGVDERILALELVCLDQPVRNVPVNLYRPEVSALYPNAPGSGLAGFNAEISVVGLPPTCTLVISARLAGERLIPFGTIRLEHAPLETTYTARVQPLMITSLGRSGSTWSMRLFGENPAIVIHRSHPYETMAANYWVHTAKVLTDPANHEQSTRRLGFADYYWKTGQNPYFTRPLIKYPEVRKWFGYELVARTAGFVQQNIDEYYLALAKAQGDPVPRFFAEKNRANHIPRMFFDIYPGAKELFVIRDFRDMACSMFSFNKKRGYVGVGPVDATDEVDFIRKLRPSIERLLESYEERADRSLLLKYEDLVLKPEETLVHALAYLGLENNRRAIRQMLQDADRPVGRSVLKGLLGKYVPKRFQARSPEFFSRMKTHSTSGGEPASSVGRWEKDLSPELQAAAHESFGDLLQTAGYEVR